MGDEGKITLFFDKGKLRIGILKDAGEKYGKPMVITEEGSEKFINKSQIYRVYDIKMEREKLPEFVDKVNSSFDEIDLETLWEISFSCPDVREIGEDEMLTTLFRTPSGEDEIALALKLNSDENIFFRRKEAEGRKTGKFVWEIRDEKDVQSLKKEKEKRKEEERVKQEVRDWYDREKEKIRDVLSKPLEVFFSGEFPRYGGELSDNLKKAFSVLRKFFVSGEERSKAKKFFGEIISMKSEDIFKILCFSGVMNPYENFFIEKFKLNRNPSSIKVVVSPTKKFEEEKSKGMRMRILSPSFSIDIEGTEIRDDAISIPKKGKEGDNFHVEIHIADTTLLDSQDMLSEVIKRGKTLYFPEGKIDMLPEEVVRELSLDSGVPKPAITFSADISIQDTDGNKGIKIRNVDVRRAEVEIKGNYEFSSDKEEIRPIKELGLKLYEIRRFDMGGLDLISEDLALFLEEGNKFPPEIKAVRWEVSDFRIAVSEFMMLCAWILAEFCRQNSIPIYYRRSKVSAEKREEMSKFNRDSEELRVFRPYIVWRNIRASRYLETVTSPAGAESIGYPLYAWGTSPLRRGWDFINIMQIGRFITGEKLLSVEELEKIKEKLQVSISNAESAEDRRYKYILAIYVLRNLKNKVLHSTLIERGKKNSIFWVDEIASFVKGDTPKKADELETVPVLLKADPLNTTIKAVPLAR